MSSKFERILSHAKKFGFFKEKVLQLGNAETLAVVANGHGGSCSRPMPTKGQSTNEYGPCGSLMRKNLLDQWWKSTITLQDRIFPLSYVETLHDLGDFGNNSPLLLPRIRALENNQTFLEGIHDNEIGFAQLTALPVDWNQKFSLSRSSVNEYLTVHYICTEKRATHVFNDFVKLRMRWWKKFANKQANFEHHSKEEADADSIFKTTSKIDHLFTFGKQTVETISLGRTVESGSFENPMNFIECCTSVEQAMLTYLDDSLEERTTEMENGEAELRHDILRLHPNLSPIKVVIFPDDVNSEEQLDLVRRLSKEIKTADILCHVLTLRDHNAILDYADAIGTAFCLKIDSRTLQRGIVSLRHRDTTVEEFMHISEVRETLSKILKYS